MEVIQDTPADRADLLGGAQLLDVDGQPVQIGGDAIVAVDGGLVAGFKEVKNFLQQAEPGPEAAPTLPHDGKKVSINVAPGEIPASRPWQKRAGESD